MGPSPSKESRDAISSSFGSGGNDSNAVAGADRNQQQPSTSSGNSAVGQLSPGAKVVLKKLQQSKFVFESREHMIESAETLSSVEKLKQVYLHKDFQVAIDMQRKLQTAKTITATADNNDLCSDIVTDDPASESNSRASCSTIDRVDVEPGSGSYHPSPLEPSSDRIRIKLVVSEIPRNVFGRGIFRLVSPILSNSDISGSEFGWFHIALVVGPWKLDWNNSGLCVPRRAVASTSLFAADIDDIATYDELDTVIDKLASVIVRWNTQRKYSAISTSEKTGNCQNFVDELLRELGLEHKIQQFPESLQTYLAKLRTHGQSEMEFEITKEFGERFGIAKQNMVFRSHLQLDEFVKMLVDKDPEFFLHYRHETMMLKSFDRAFWMRYLNPDLTDVESIHRYQPSINTYSLNTDSEEESCSDDEDKKNVECTCPFGDPLQTHSLIQWRQRKQQQSAGSRSRSSSSREKR